MVWMELAGRPGRRARGRNSARPGRRVLMDSMELLEPRALAVARLARPARPAPLVHRASLAQRARLAWTEWTATKGRRAIRAPSGRHWPHRAE